MGCHWRLIGRLLQEGGGTSEGNTSFLQKVGTPFVPLCATDRSSRPLLNQFSWYFSRIRRLIAGAVQRRTCTPQAEGPGVLKTEGHGLVQGVSSATRCHCPGAVGVRSSAVQRWLQEQMPAALHPQDSRGAASVRK